MRALHSAGTGAQFIIYNNLKNSHNILKIMTSNTNFLERFDFLQTIFRETDFRKKKSRRCVILSAPFSPSLFSMNYLHEILRL